MKTKRCLSPTIPIDFDYDFSEVKVTRNSVGGDVGGFPTIPTPAEEAEEAFLNPSEYVHNPRSYSKIDQFRCNG